ncbi:MAG: hypothetical protein J6P13_03535 [Kiritimatiellae bacterium]|nr:hypothetical protein [Kiritimatiellia bacterium]
MKPRNILFAAAAALLASMRAVFAATPVVVWDGDFGTSAKTGTDGKTYTLVLPSGSESWVQADGTLKIGSGTQGAYINLQDGETYNLAQGTKISVLMEYENATALSVVASPIYLQADSYFGLKTKASSLEVVGDNWGVTYPTSGNAVTTMPAAGNMLMVYPQGSGAMKIYSAATRSGLSGSSSGGEITGLLFSNKRLQKIGIGGCFTSGAAKDLNNFENLIIKKVAVFASAITATDATEYFFPSEIQTINVSAADSIAVSEINDQIDANTYKTVKVVAEDGATITVDAAFSTTLPIAVSSTGSITLSAASQPDASYFTGVDFSGVQGAVLRSWLATPGVVGFNFNSANGTDTSAALVAGTWQANASDASGSSDLFGDGVSTLTWSSENTWEGGTYYFTDGYLDDGANGGNGATVTLSGVPYETYDVVIYASTDNGDGFTSKTVNGTSYTWNAAQGAVAAGSASWGKTALTTAIYGLNALRIKNLSGPLSISGGAKSGNIRGGIAAIQIMPPTAEDIVKTYTLTLDGSATTWSAGTWRLDGANVSAPTAGNVVINATASTTLTLDADVTLSDVTVNGGANIVVNLALGEKTAADGDTAATYYSFYAGRVAVASGVLQQGSSAVLGSTPVVTVADGATFDLNAFAINAATAVYVEGAGAGDWPWALTSSGNAFAGTIQNMYLTGNAAIGGEYKIVLGADWAGSYCYLQNHTLVKTGTGELLVRNLNIPDDGTVIVRGGELHTDQWNCLNKNTSGTVTLKIEAGGTVRGTNQQSNPPAATTLDWEGTLNTASRTFIVKSALSGGGTTANLNFEANATANLKRDLTITSSLTLSGDASFLKDAEATADVTVSPAALAASGAITVGAGVVFNLGTARPAASFTVDDAGTLVVQKSSATDVPVVKVSARPENVVFKDENGTEIESPKLVYDSEAGTLTFYAGNVWTAADGTAFDTPANWSSDATPAEGENATVSISGDTAITVAGTYTLNALTVTGAGEVTFTGAGSVTAANIYLENGATLKRDGATISATTGISLASGTVLKLDGVTENAAISGAGAVETYGNVNMAGLNTATGGITAKTGTLSTTAYSTDPWCSGFGPYSSGWNCNQIKTITVEDGACVDLNNTINTADGIGYKLVIAGKGVLSDGVYSGAVKYTGASAVGAGSRQLSNIELAGDALIDLGAGWGLVHSGYGAATLALNNHTLTVRGTAKQNFPMQNVTASSGGKIVLDGANLLLGANDSNLTGVDVVINGGAKLQLGSKPTAIASVVALPSATASSEIAGYANMTNVVPVVKTVNIDSSALSVGDTITLMTADTALTEGENVTIVAGSRYTTTVSEQSVTATVNALAPFFHYDFNAANSIASDSTYNFGNLNPTFVSARNGRAGVFVSGTTPWYDNNNSGKSPFHAGEMTVMGLVKAKEANNTILWNFGSGWSTGIAVIAKDSTTFALVSWEGGAAGSEVASVSNIDVLNKWHLVTVVANSNGTTLYVDGESASTATVLPSGITAVGQFGSIHGTAKNYNAVGDAGYYLDDWCVYDAALTKGEVSKKFLELCPPPTKIIMR